MINGQILESYKPLRNHLRQLSLRDSLYVLWAYIQHLQFNNSIPNDIDVPLEVALAKNKITKQFYEWELEVLIREVIINAQASNFAGKTLRKWGYFAGAVNKLKNLENEIGRKFIDTTNILTELHRIAHRQFPWQSRLNKEYITRYFKIFNSIPLSNIIQNVIGLSTQELYLAGMIFWGFYINHFALIPPISIKNIPEVTQENLEKFLNRFSCDLANLKKRLIEEQEINEKFAYSYSSLRAYPITRIQRQDRDNLVCPAPTLLAWRLTNGIYYEICNEKDFDIEFGKSFQNYVGEVIGTGNKKINIYPEEEYYDGKNRKDTVDWIAADDESALFVECKAKRITVPAKTEIRSEEELKKELDTMADFIIQTYKNIADYYDNKYPSFKSKENKTIFPLIVTLEDWYLFGDKLVNELRGKVKEKFKTSNLPHIWLSEAPYSVCSVQEFEAMVQIMEKVGIKTFMGRKVYDQDKEKWMFFPFMKSEFPEENKTIRFLFPNDFDAIFPKRLFDQYPNLSHSRS